MTRKEYDAAWRDRNREKIRQQQKAWYLANREKCNRNAVEWRARKKDRSEVAQQLGSWAGLAA